MEIGIIGFGRFGKLIAKYLSKDFKVYVYDKSDKSKEIKENGLINSSLEEICKKDIVIPCVPISEFEDTLKKIKNLLRKNALVVDVCSVKEYPVKVMKKILLEDIEIFATHPMFGPDSAAESLDGRKIVLCRIRISNEKYKKIKDYLKSKGLIIIESSPEQHDKESSKSMLLSHLIGRSLVEFGAEDMEIDTTGYKKLVELKNVIKNDSWQLFEDINKYNKYSKDTWGNYLKSIETVRRKLQK